MKKNEVIAHNYYFFCSGGRKWGIDISAIREVGELEDTLCKVPHAQHSVMGYLNVRGSIIQLVSFKSLLSGKKEEEVAGGLVLYLKEQVSAAIGLYIDKACEILAISDKAIESWEPQKTNGSIEFDMAEFLTNSVYRSSEEVVPLIDPQRIERALHSHELDNK